MSWLTSRKARNLLFPQDMTGTGGSRSPDDSRSSGSPGTRTALRLSPGSFRAAALCGAFLLASALLPSPRTWSPVLSPAPDPQVRLPNPESGTRGAGQALGDGSYRRLSDAAAIADSLSVLSLPGPRGPALPLAGLSSSGSLQADLETPPLSDGQFVWGPNVGPFNIYGYLVARSSPLAAYAPEIAVWAAYTSVNPKLLLGVLEFQHGLVTAIPAGWSADDVVAAIENTSLTMATAYYEHLHTWGERGPAVRARSLLPPAVQLEDGTIVQLDPDEPSGTFALAALLADSSNRQDLEAALTMGGAGSFEEVFGALFPSVDLTDTSNLIDPPGTPPANMLQFPFALGGTWTFGGPHSWNGNSSPPFSSMDFFIGGSTCAAPYYLFSVASASGTATRPYGYSCWLEITHGAGWTTSYYHLQNLTAASSAERNDPLGTIACEICAGGYATGPHVHWSLKFNGAYVDLEGVELSGWTIHPGAVAYTSGSIERDGVSLNPYSQVLNDYHSYFGSGVDTSLEFYGAAASPAGRVLMPVDSPSDTRRGPPIDVGGSDDFMIDVWIRALPGANAAPAITCGANANWTQGNIVLDRRRTGGAGFGVSLAGGRAAFGVTGPALGNLTLCSTTDIADGQWHLITISRNRWDGTQPDGFMWLFIDGVLEASGAGPGGDLSYPDSATASSPGDPYLVLGADKYDVGLPFRGWLDEIRVSNVLRTRASFARPTAPFANDPNTAAVFHLDEGAGDVIFDTSGFGGGPSPARRSVAGSPAGPAWSTENAFTPPLPTPTPTVTASASPTPTASATATSTHTRTPTATATPTSTASNTPIPSSTATQPATSTATSTATPTDTPSPTPTATDSPTPVATATPLPTPTLIPSATPGGPGLVGDVSLDGLVNVIDVQMCVNVILGSETTPEVVIRADVNGDGGVNVLDVQAIVNIILGT